MKQIFTVFFVLIFVIAKAQPANDNPCGATVLSVDASCTLTAQTTAGSTVTASVPTPPCGLWGKDIWFSLTVPASGHITLQTASGTITDGVMAVYTGPDCSTLTEVACDDDSGPGLMPELDITGLTPGTTVWIRFSKYNTGTGTFYICAWDNVTPSTLNTDCTYATQLCNTSTFDDNSDGSGTIVDLTAANEGCLSTGEHQSAWYIFQFATSGTFTITIDPVINSNDFDFGVWGPNPVCSPSTSPVRCSYSALSGNTGINTAATDLSENALGDKWVKYMDVIAGDQYLLLVDNFSMSNSGFTISFGGTATIDCSPITLPVTLSSFNGYEVDDANMLQWNTASEINSAYFNIERAKDGNNFSEAGRVAASGTSTSAQYYSFKDNSPYFGNTYYRLKQVDVNGNFQYSKIIAVINTSLQFFMVYPNPTTNGIITVSCNVNETEKTNIKISNTYGEIIYTKDISSLGGYVTEQINLPSKGMYWVSLRKGSEVSVQKIIY